MTKPKITLAAFACLVVQSSPARSGKNGVMTFDYTLREGPVTSGNALRLMQGVGFAVPPEDDGPHG